MTTKYYLGFKSSDSLVKHADRVLENRANGAVEPYAPMMQDIVKYFVPEMIDNFMIKTADAVGLSPRMSKIVHGAADTISKASKVLVGRLLAKRSNEELENLVQFVDETYLRADESSNNANSCGCEIDKELHDRMKHVVREVREGRSQEVLEELHDLMIETVDAVIEGMLIRAISLLNINFVLRKLCDATVATCRGAGHMVVNRVFKKLDDDELRRLADYFDGLILTAEKSG